MWQKIIVPANATKNQDSEDGVCGVRGWGGEEGEGRVIKYVLSTFK